MDKIDDFIAALIQQGLTIKDIRYQLERHYQLASQVADERIAEFLSKQASPQIHIPTIEHKKRIHMTGVTDMVIGSGICIVMIVIMMITLSDNSNFILIWSGLLFVFGMYRLIKGLWAFLRGRYPSG